MFSKKANQQKTALERLKAQEKLKSDLGGTLLSRRLAAKTTSARPKQEKKAARSAARDPERMKAFLAGSITLAELEGIPKAAQYKMAKVGRQHLRTGKLETAERIFKGLLALDPKDAYFHLALGAIEQRRENLAAAEAHYTRALELDPGSCPALANRGEVRMMLGKMVEGAKDLVQAMERDPKGTNAATKRAIATMQLVKKQLMQAGPELAPAPSLKKKPAAPKPPSTRRALARPAPKSPTPRR